MLYTNDRTLIESDFFLLLALVCYILLLLLLLLLLLVFGKYLLLK